MRSSRTALKCAAAGFAVFCLLAAGRPAAAEESRPALEIGSRLELFIDDYLVETLSGDAARRLHHPVPREIVHTLDEPWEGNTSAYFSVVRADGLVRIYYNATPRRQTTAVIESPDGINFSRPSLGLWNYRGSTENNLLPFGMPQGHNFTPFLDPRPGVPDDERFKAIAYPGVSAYASADGIEWRRLVEEPVILASREDYPRGPWFDSQNLAFWDPERGHYACYYRGPDPRSGVYRGIWRAVSDDFINWRDNQPIAFTDDRREEMYTNGIQPYFRAPHIYIGLPNRLVRQRRKVPEHPYRGISEVVLMSSRDGKLFERWEEGFIRPGPEPEMWTERNIYPALGMLQLSPEEITLYWTEHYRHPGMRLRRGTIRTDGFVSVSSGAAGGELLTRPLIFSGDRLVVNYETSAAGRIRFELVDGEGDPIPGFSLAESETLFGNEIEHMVSWRGGSDLSALAGRSVRLRVELEDADLYSIRFEPAEEIAARLSALAERARQALADPLPAFAARCRGELEDTLAVLEQGLSDHPEPASLVAAFRLERALGRHRDCERARKQAAGILAAAGAAQVEDGFGGLYHDAVVILREELKEALDCEESSRERVRRVAGRLEGALAGLDKARALREKAAGTLEAALFADELPQEGFGLLYRQRIERRARDLRREIENRRATAGSVRRAIAALDEAVAKGREVEHFPPLERQAVAGRRVVHEISGRDRWQSGLLVGLETEGDDLVLRRESALRFEGEPARVEFPAGPGFRTPVFTVEARVRVEDPYRFWFPVVRLARRFEEAGAWTEHAWNLWFRGATPELTLGSGEDGALARCRGSAIEIDAWQHLAGSYDGRHLRLYLNGRLARAVEHEAEIDHAWSEVLQIGGRAGGYGVWFLGRISDVRVWNTVRTEEQIRENMDRTLSGEEEGLAGYWLGGPEAGEGRTVFDLSGHGNHGEIRGAAWQADRGYRLAGPVTFPGVTDLAGSSIAWRAGIEGDPALSSLEILVGVSDDARLLPDEWRRAVNEGPVPGLEAGAHLRGKYLWLKQRLGSDDPAAGIRLREITLELE